MILQGMIDGLCNLDILLDPMFLHFPRLNEDRVWYPGLSVQRANLPNLITAQSIDHAAERWRNPFRVSVSSHPGPSIPLLVGNCFDRE